MKSQLAKQPAEVTTTKDSVDHSGEIEELKVKLADLTERPAEVATPKDSVDHSGEIEELRAKLTSVEQQSAISLESLKAELASKDQVVEVKTANETRLQAVEKAITGHIQENKDKMGK